MQLTFIHEKETTSMLKDTIVPWFNETVQHDYIYTQDGTKLSVYHAVHPNEIGAIQFFHGFCEFIGKYHEFMYLFYQAGYSVYFAEMRGHGKSQKILPEKDHVTVGSFQEYVQDQKAFFDQFLDRKSNTNQRILFGHSMGGCVGALFLEQYPGLFSKAILSSPMFELNYRGTPNWQVKALTIASKTLNWDERLNPGASGWTGNYEYETSGYLSQARYDYQLELRRNNESYQTWTATMGWTRAADTAIKESLENAPSIEIPIILFQAEKDTMVNPGGQIQFVSAVPNVTLIEIKDSKHEIYNGNDEIRAEYLNRISTFLEN